MNQNYGDHSLLPLPNTNDISDINDFIEPIHFQTLDLPLKIEIEKLFLIPTRLYLSIFIHQPIHFQTHPTSFPGQAPTDCPRDTSKVTCSSKSNSMKMNKEEQGSKRSHLKRYKYPGGCSEDEMFKRGPPRHPRPL